MSQPLKPLIASEIIIDNSTAFINETVKNGLPSPIDGLLSVNRRILQSPKPGHLDKWATASSYIASVVKTHNHGDGSIWQSLVNMTLTYKSLHPLVDFQGTSKSYTTADAAAPRYCENKISDFCIDAYFDGIDISALPNMDGSDPNTTEVKYFVPKLPVVLINPVKFIGFGYGADTYPIALKDVCDLVIHYIENKGPAGEWDYDEVIDKFLPTYPMKGNIIQSEELKREYLRGNFLAPIRHEGSVHIKSPNSFLVKTHAWGVAHLTIINSVISDKRKKTGWVYDCGLEDPHSLTTDGDTADCTFAFKRTFGFFDVFEKAKKTLGLEGKHHPQHNYQIEGKRVSMSPPEIIKLWYGERRTSIMNHKRSKLQKLNHKLSEYRALLKLKTKKDVTDAINIIRNGTDANEVHFNLQERFSLTPSQAIIISDMKLIKLSGFNVKDITKRLLDTENELNLLIKSFDFIDTEIINDMMYFKSKYANIRNAYMTRVPGYIGILHIIGQGMICIRNLNDLRYHSDIFKAYNQNFIKLGNLGELTLRGPSFRTIKSMGGVCGLPRYNGAAKIQYKSDVDNILHLIDDKWRVGYNPDLPNVFVKEKHMAICRDRIIRPCTIEQIRATRKWKHDEIFHFDGKFGDKVHVIYTSPGQPGFINGIRVTLTKDKLIPIDARHDNMIITVLPVGFEEEYIFTRGIMPFNAFLLNEKSLPNKINQISVVRLSGKLASIGGDNDVSGPDEG